ncbi:MAG TPA: hypothetical protein VEA37_08105, partial [Flavobacterium sp.]|nr:hypothetical protein [Flavobacterium sp.]
MEITHNQKKNGIELRFSGKPDASDLHSIKSMGFRFSKNQKMWYAAYSKKRWDFVQALKNGDVSAFAAPGFEPSLHNIDVRNFSYISITAVKNGQTIHDYRLLFEPVKKKAEDIALNYANTAYGAENVHEVVVYPRKYVREARVLFKQGNIISGRMNNSKEFAAGGPIIGPAHGADGGVKCGVRPTASSRKTTAIVEVEGDEFYIHPELLRSQKIKTRTGTCRQIILDIIKDNGGEIKPITKGNCTLPAETIIITKGAKTNHKIYKFTGTDKEILSKINQLNGGVKFEGGGVVETNQDTLLIQELSHFNIEVHSQNHIETVYSGTSEEIARE